MADQPTGDAAEALARVADRVYAVPPEAFTESRNLAARELDDKGLAVAVRKLRKPSIAAWALNNLVRRESGQIDQVLVLADSLRAAARALDGDELRALNRQRRQLTSALASTARGLARDAGVRISDVAVDQVEGMLTAAMLDPLAAQVVRTGRVCTAFTSTGVSEIDVAAVVAVPEALGILAVSVTEEPGAPADLRVVPDRDARLAAARDAVDEAAARLVTTERELAEAREAVQTLNARRLQLQGEADELRRRLAHIEDGVEEVDDGLEEAEEAAAGALDAVRHARAAHDRAHAALAQLDS